MAAAEMKQMVVGRQKMAVNGGLAVVAPRDDHVPAIRVSALDGKNGDVSRS